MFIPKECIGYHVHWISEGKGEETMDDIETIGLAKTILSVHHELNVLTGKDPDGLGILDDILNKLACHLDGKSWMIMNQSVKREREYQVQFTKDLVKKGQLTLLDSVCILYTKNELGIYGI